MGCLWGALVGDAAGGVLEFLGRCPSEDEVEQALRFPGGGVHALAPGQITDDGELLLCLARGLVAASTSTEDPVELVAQQYYLWMQSPPFDIGNTTMASIGKANPANYQDRTCASAMRNAAADRCMPSKANGSLMRCMPLALWGSASSEAELVESARSDSALSHPNSSCQDAVAAYVLACRHAITNSGDHLGAFQIAQDWAKAKACSEVQEWLLEAKAGTPPKFHPKAGFIKIAFTHAFFHLALGSSYPEALRAVLLGGGDTDTNACIVGGLIGALHGAEAIPASWREAVLRCDTQKGRARPDWLKAESVLSLAAALLGAGQ